MNLFLNAVSSHGIILLFDENRNIISKQAINVAWNESEKLIPILDNFLKDNNIKYSDLQNLVVVAWPWSFTWIRTITLMINTINFVIKGNITALNYFDLFDNFPVIKSSSKRDSFFKKNQSSQIEIMQNEEILKYLQENNITELYWENKNIENIKIFENIDYSAIIKNIDFQQNKKINPIYLKRPSIS